MCILTSAWPGLDLRITCSLEDLWLDDVWAWDWVEKYFPPTYGLVVLGCSPGGGVGMTLIGVGCEISCTQGVVLGRVVLLAWAGTSVLLLVATPVERNSPVLLSVWWYDCSCLPPSCDSELLFLLKPLLVKCDDFEGSDDLFSTCGQLDWRARLLCQRSDSSITQVLADDAFQNTYIGSQMSSRDYLLVGINVCIKMINVA